MIDQQLIEKNIATINDRVSDTVDLGNGLRLVPLAFDQLLIDKLLDYLDNNPHGDWQPETTANYQLMLHKPRLKLSWHADTVIEEAHCVCQSLTPLINHLYPGRNLQFHGITVWKDSAGYDITWHTDNPVIGVSMQIYLNSQGLAPGTEFQLPGGNIIVPFVTNSGYVASNDPSQRLMHKIQHPVSDNCTRWSLFAMWSSES